MRILAIETSCDETAISLIEASPSPEGVLSARILGNKLLSQALKHAPYGGVYPNLAKREHARNLVPLLAEVLREAGEYRETERPLTAPELAAIKKTLEREPELFEELAHLLSAIETPRIDAIAVTHGPGLEPALWVGINAARALGFVWQKPVIPINHMEGHIFSAMLKRQVGVGGERGAGDALSKTGTYDLKPVTWPLLALLISGGHTELVLMKDWGSYELIGATRDDAVGEAFDKVARMLGLPYPGGPEVSKRAEAARRSGLAPTLALPRPMMQSETCDFSFSGLKTAVRYHIEKLAELSERDVEEISLAFEDAVADVLLAKTLKALEQYGVQTFVMGGGVSANTHLRRTFREKLAEVLPAERIFIPEAELTTDNAVMIALAAALRLLDPAYRAPAPETIAAQGNLALA